MSITFGLCFALNTGADTAEWVFHPPWLMHACKHHRTVVMDAARSRVWGWPGLCPSASLGWGPGSHLGFLLLGEQSSQHGGGVECQWPLLCKGCVPPDLAQSLLSSGSLAWRRLCRRGEAVVRRGQPCPSSWAVTARARENSLMSWFFFWIS